MVSAAMEFKTEGYARTWRQDVFHRWSCHRLWRERLGHLWNHSGSVWIKGDDLIWQNKLEAKTLILSSSPLHYRFTPLLVQKKQGPLAGYFDLLSR